MRIDVHHHFFPASLNKAKSNEDVGWITPPDNLPWSPEISVKSMDASSIDIAILSFPALSSGFVGDENRRVVRERNTFLAETCKGYPGRFGFFASLPFMDDVEGESCFFGTLFVKVLNSRIKERFWRSHTHLMSSRRMDSPCLQVTGWDPLPVHLLPSGVSSCH